MGENQIVPVSSFAVMQASVPVGEILAANVGNQQLTPNDLTLIKVPAGGATTWELPSITGTMETKELDGVIIHHTTPRAYWPEKYGTGEGNVPPECYSEDGVQPATYADGDCLTCPFNKWGSGEEDTSATRGRKACKEMHLIYFLQAGGLLPKVLRVPPSSLNPVKKYLLGLANEGLRYDMVQTRFALKKVQGKFVYAEIVPTFLAKLNDEEFQALQKYGASFRELFDAKTTELVAGAQGEE